MPETPGVAATLTTRPLRLEDAEAVFELTRDAELHDTGHSLVEIDDIRSDWSQPSYDLAAQSVGYVEDNLLVAYGEVNRNRLESYVHPGSRGRGIGTSLFAWGIEKARELGYDRIGQTVPVTNTEALALFRRFGCELLWTSWILELPEGAAIGEAQLPDGFRLRDFDQDRDARAVYQTFEDAFNEWPNRLPTAFDDWTARMLARADFEPWQFILVVHEVDGQEQVVGACKVTANEGEGWIDQIALRRDARGHGLGRALLVAAFARARSRGAVTSRLNTDSRTGALGLYEHVGMTVVETYEHHARSLVDE